MKLLLENWRQYLIESEKSTNYGNLYLFEDDSVQKVSFYDRYISLNESDEDFEVFLEQWEKSVDYIFDNLEEQKAFHYMAPKKKTVIDQTDDAILKASTQA